MAGKKCAVVGYGYWGVNVAHTLCEVSAAEFYALCEIDCARVELAQKTYPNLKHYTDFDALLGDKNIECVFLITPPHTHFLLAKKVLDSGKHCFVEKPLCLQYAQALELYELAEKKNLVLYCDHIFLHSSAVRYLKENLSDFGNIISITARRINLGLFQAQTDVIWDLAIHDLSIIDYLVGLEIRRASVFSTKYLNHPNPALANISLELENGVIVLIHVSWLSPTKVRELSIGGSNQSAIYDETKREKLKIYKSGVVVNENLTRNDLYQKMVEYRLGEILSPMLPQKLALNASIECFLALISEIENRARDNLIFYRTHTLRVVKALESLSEIQSGGEK